MSEQTATPPATPTPVQFTPEQQQVMNSIIDKRIGETKAKYADYEDLRKTVEAYNKEKETLSQKQLEEQKQYEELKKGWGAKEEQYKGLLNQRETELRNERISNKLSFEVSKQGAYPDAVELLKSSALYKDDGSIVIRGKDSNGIATELPIEEGVKQFLKERAYLVRSSGTGGAGTGGVANTNAGQVNPNENLAGELQAAMNRGDRAKVNEIKSKINAKHQAAGILR
jgi:hypothetical protein